MNIRRVVLACFMMLLLPVFSGPARAGTPPEAAYIPGFIGHAQTYSLSCESRSAVDWAGFWGVNIAESEFLNALPRSDNPEAGFVGNPNGFWGNIPPGSYGVHAGPVAELLRQYGLRARARRGLGWDELRAEIAAGRPAIVWVIGGMWPGAPLEYTASDGQVTTVARFEHSMVLVGYNATQVFVVDAYTGWSQTYSLDAFLASWEVLGNMAVLGGGKRKNLLPTEATPTPKRTRKRASTPAAPGAAAQYSILLPFVSMTAKSAGLEAAGLPTEDTRPDTYIVQRGEFLIELAERFSLDWRRLAELNGIAYPYVIYPGQVLKLK